MSDTGLRQSGLRWQQVSQMVRRLEQLVRANTTLDLDGASREAKRLESAQLMEQELMVLAGLVDREANQLTAELLLGDLERKKRNQVKAAPRLAGGLKRHSRLTRSDLLELAEHCGFSAKVMADTARVKVSIMRYRCKAKGIAVN